MCTKFLILLSVILSLSLVAAPSNAAVKAGAKCTKAGATSLSAGKKYTCVKSGNKLVWNKGVTVKAAPKPDLNPVFKPVEPTPTPTPTPVATPTPTPIPTPTVQLPAEGSLCTKVGSKIMNGNSGMRCSWGGHANTTEEAAQRLLWRSYTTQTISTSKSNNYTSTPAENAPCSNSGDTFDVTGGILECRWVAGMQRKWIKINSVKNTFNNANVDGYIDNLLNKVIVGQDSGVKAKVIYILKQNEPNNYNLLIEKIPTYGITDIMSNGQMKSKLEILNEVIKNKIFFII